MWLWLDLVHQIVPRPAGWPPFLDSDAYSIFVREVRSLSGSIVSYKLSSYALTSMLECCVHCVERTIILRSILQILDCDPESVLAERRRNQHNLNQRF